MRPFATCGCGDLASLQAWPASAFSGDDVLQHACDAARRVGVGDARAHHAGAEHADLRAACHARTPVGRDWPDLIAFRSKKNALIMFFAVWPTMTLASLRLSMRSRGVEVDLRAFDHRLEDRLGRRVQAARLLRSIAGATRERRRRSSGSPACRRASCSPCSSHGCCGVADGRRSRPAPPARSSSASRRQPVDQAELDRLARAEQLAFQQVRLRRHQAEHPHHLGDAGGAGDQAERHLGRAELDLRVVEREAVRGRSAPPPSRRRAPRRSSSATTGLPSVSMRAEAAFIASISAKPGGASRRPQRITPFRSAPAKKVVFAEASSTPLDPLLVAHEPAPRPRPGRACHSGTSC